MKYLLKLMRFRQQDEMAKDKETSVKAVLNEIQGMFAENNGWTSEEEMLKDLAGFKRERIASCAS